MAAPPPLQHPLGLLRSPFLFLPYSPLRSLVPGYYIYAYIRKILFVNLSSTKMATLKLCLDHFADTVAILILPPKLKQPIILIKMTFLLL